MIFDAGCLANRGAECDPRLNDECYDKSWSKRVRNTYHIFVWQNQVSKILFLAGIIIRMNLFICGLNLVYLLITFQGGYQNIL
jgi:hypothetical protein